MPIHKKIEPHIKNIIKKIHDSGYEAYIVGGAVRDLLLNVPPKDYDIATSATPKEIKNIFGYKYAKIVGKRFKIVHLYHNNKIIEISTFRGGSSKINKKEITASDSLIIWSDNEYGTAYEDAWRRDFTINAIFYDPIKHRFIDYTEKGLKDLEMGLIRCIGEPHIKFAEDPVRILRALKLTAQYNFIMTQETKRALFNSLEKITLCSKPRLFLELEKIIQKPFLTKTLKVFHDYNFLQYYLPMLEKHWESPAFTAATELLQLYESITLREKNSQIHTVTILTLTALPFFNELFTTQSKNVLWDYYPTIEKDMRELLNDIFYPFCFPKYITHMITNITMLQKFFYNKKNPEKLSHNKHFKIAREIALILNRAWWKDPEVRNFWLSVIPTHIKKQTPYKKY